MTARSDKLPPLASLVTPEFQSSLTSICGESNQAVVFGVLHCGYGKVALAINMINSEPYATLPIKRAFLFTLGDPEGIETNVTTLEGRKMNLLKFDPSTPKKIGRMCKTALADVVLENYKREREGLPLIPLLFCIDITDNPRPFSPATILSKAPGLNKQITHKEFRRAFKLCTHPKADVRRIALQTFKFVKVCVQKDTCTLEQIPAPWASTVDSPEKVSHAFAAHWKVRQSKSKSEPKPNGWSQQLERQMADYDRSKKTTSLHSTSVPGRLDSPAHSLACNPLPSPAAQTN